VATVTINLAKLESLAEEKAIKGIQTAAARGEAILNADLLSRPGSGELYGKHRASAPGEPPAPDTGRLRAATQADEQVRREGDDLVGRVVANTEYALALEKGTERMAARPFLSRLKSDHSDDLRAAFVEGAKQ
jgi:hypothetical protein